MAGDAPLLLFLDLGDLLTKALAVVDGKVRRFGFPSVIARELLPDDAEGGSLQIDQRQPLPRLVDFDPDEFPRTRSYPGSREFLRSVERVPGARFAGWQAAAHGADRVLLGAQPTADNIEALLHRALMRCDHGGDSADVVFIVDTGAKADALVSFAGSSPRSARFVARSFRGDQPQKLEITVRSRVVDAADCALASVPREVGLEVHESVMLVDVGYLRTKLSVHSRQGCEYQEELDGVGISSCVHRVLRDGQEQGLIEDEIAVVRALEASRHSVEVAGRRFDISRPMKSSVDELEEELFRAVQRVAIAHSARRGSMCTAIAILGGGAAVTGDRLVARLRAASLGFAESWVTSETRFLLVDGALSLESTTA